MKGNGQDTTSTTMPTVTICQDDYECQCKTQHIPWWHYAGKVAALFLLANAVAFIWAELFGAIPDASVWLKTAVTLIFAALSVMVAVASDRE